MTDTARTVVRNVPSATIPGFDGTLASDAASVPQPVTDAQLAQSDAAPGKRPTRPVVAIAWGVDEMIAFARPRQDAPPEAMQFDTLLRGADA